MKNIIMRIVDYIKRPKIIPIYRQLSEQNEFEGKVAMIAGGTGGIGKSIAEQLIGAGCTVIVTGTRSEKLELIEKELGCFTFRLDYTKTSDLSNEIKEIIRKFGKIDIFISAVGVHTENANYWSMSTEEFERVMKINLEGTFFACQEIARHMIDNSIKGKILLISSSRGSEPAWSPYGISKWGLKGLTEGLAKMLLPKGIIVNSIAPGTTATELINYKDGDSIYANDNTANRMIMPEEIAALAKYLVSERCQMISGQTIYISAGRGIFDIR